MASTKRVLQQKDPLLAVLIIRCLSYDNSRICSALQLAGQRIRSTLQVLRANLQHQWLELEGQNQKIPNLKGYSLVVFFLLTQET